MSAAPSDRGRSLAHWLAGLAPSLWRDLTESGVVPTGLESRTREEWEALLLYGCVRGAVAAGGFNRESIETVDALNGTFGRDWSAERRTMLADRYADYGAIGQELQHAGADRVEARLGEACAAHVQAPPDAALAEVLAAMHESIVEASAEVMRAPHPPLTLLQEAGERLRRAGIEWGLGGSGLLHAHALASHIGDWDLQCDASPEECERALAGLVMHRSDHGGCHADHKLALWDGAVEVIARFAFFTPRGVVRIPARVNGSWQGVPLVSRECWAVAYTLLGELDGLPARTEKAEQLFDSLERTGADPSTVAALLSQPLSDGLLERLRSLPPQPVD